MEDVYLQHEFIWLFRCNIIITLPGQWSLITISQYNHHFILLVPDWPLPPHVYIPSESEMALRARIYAYNRHLSFDVAFICSTLTHCGVCDLSVWRLKWEVSYVHQRVWRWKWFSCQSSYVLQRLWLCRASDTVFRREIDSQRQWGYGTCYGDSFPRCEGVYIIIIFCKIGASQLDTPVTTLDRITITYTCAHNRIHFFSNTSVNWQLDKRIPLSLHI